MYYLFISFYKVVIFREALKAGKEEWKRDRNERFNQALADVNWDAEKDHRIPERANLFKKIYKRVNAAKWGNVSVEDPVYAETVHFVYINDAQPNLAPPLIEAAMRGYHEIVELLLDHGADVEILTKHLGNGREGNVSLAVAARQDSILSSLHSSSSLSASS